MIIKKFKNGLTLESYFKKNGKISISLNKQTKYSDLQKDWIKMCGLFLESKFERFVYPINPTNGNKLTECYPQFVPSMIEKLTSLGELIDSLDSEPVESSEWDILHEEYMDGK